MYSSNLTVVIGTNNQHGIRAENVITVLRKGVFERDTLTGNGLFTIVSTSVKKLSNTNFILKRNSLPVDRYGSGMSLASENRRELI